MRVLETPQPWIAVAVALIAMAAVLLVVGRRRARRTASPGPSGPGTARHRAVLRPVPPPGAAPVNGDRCPGRGGPAARMLHGGAEPRHVAAALGVDEHELAHRVASELGLFPSRAQGTRRGTNRTVEPGRAWATAGSASASTTPTTG